MASAKVTQLRLAAAKTSPLKARGPAAAPPDNLVTVLRALRERNGYDLSDDEQRVLRACMCLAGETITPRGLCDLDFFVALDRYQTARGASGGLTRETIDAIVASASLNVGASGRWAVVRAGWFDAFEAPRYLRELSSLALLIRALREVGRTS